MENEKEEETPVKETVEHPEKVGETEATPPPVAPAHAESVSKDAFDELTSKVDGLVEIVQSIATPQTDSQPIKRPWTHWGAK